MAVKDRRYRVLKDSSKRFKTGDIVVAIETGTLVYCVPENLYVKGLSWSDYANSGHIVTALFDRELEELESEVK